jgi:hypothetical protein
VASRSRDRTGTLLVASSNSNPPRLCALVVLPGSWDAVSEPVVEYGTRIEVGVAARNSSTNLTSLCILYVFFSRFITFFSRFKYVHWNIITSSPIRTFVFGRRYVPILKTFLHFFKKSEFRRRRTAGRPRERA